MTGLKRYCTAFNRYRRSKGFGIHSPFAFRFVLSVLREKHPYYAYAALAEKRREAVRLRKLLAGKPAAVVPEKEARMIFRVANHFNPRHILQFGEEYGLAAFSALAVSSGSRMWLCGDSLPERVLGEIAERVEVLPVAADAIGGYCMASGNERRFVIVNRVNPSDIAAVERWLISPENGEAVIVMRNLERDKEILRLWDGLLSAAGCGMSFSNGKIGIFVVSGKLPRQHFKLWF